MNTVYQIKMFKGFHDQLNEETINRWLLENSHNISNIINISHSPHVGGGCITVAYIQKNSEIKT